MAQLEASIEKYLTKRVAQAGGKQIKIELRAHWPDRLIAMPFHGLYLVETKKPKGGVLSTGQKMLHEELRLIGTLVRVIWTKQHVDDFIKETAL